MTQAKYEAIESLLSKYPQASFSGSGNQALILIEKNEVLKNIKLILEGL